MSIGIRKWKQRVSSIKKTTYRDPTPFSKQIFINIDSNLKTKMLCIARRKAIYFGWFKMIHKEISLKNSAKDRIKMFNGRLNVQLIWVDSKLDSTKLNELEEPFTP